MLIEEEEEEETKHHMKGVSDMHQDPTMQKFKKPKKRIRLRGLNEYQSTTNAITKPLEVPSVNEKELLPNKWSQIKVYQDNLILINPRWDASNKQIFANNQFRTNTDAII